jgi:cytoskeletal protein CcmA (bactofilin family)
VVFRRDSKVDAFQRQISALRHQLGGEGEDPGAPDRDRSRSSGRESPFLSEYPEFPLIESERTPIARGLADTLDSALPDSMPPPIPAIDFNTSVIAHSTAWSGDLESSGSLHVHGRVKGSLTAQDTVFIAEEADVDAVIRAANVTVAGNVRGSVHCSERFEVLPRGKVAGDIHAPAIAIHDGAVVAGEISMAASKAAKSSQPPAVRVARGGD